MASDIIVRWKASALSTALIIYPCQIQVHQRWQSKLQLPTARKKEWAAGHSGQFTPMRLPVNTVIHTTLVGLEPATFRSLVRRAPSSATEPTRLCYGLRGIRPIRFENESDGRFDSRFDSNEKNDSQVPSLNAYLQQPATADEITRQWPVWLLCRDWNCRATK